MTEDLRILIVEDVPTDAELVESELQDAGMAFSAKRVATKKAYIAALSTFLPHVILSDYSLPSFDGITALKLRRELCPDIPFIFVTGALGEELAIDLLKQGATDYVLKSRLSRLPVAVNRALREVKERKERERTQAELQEAQNEILSHLRFFEKMDTINRAMQGTNGLDQIINDVLDIMLSIFDCDRVWLVHPWDPDAAYQSVIERTRPEYRPWGVIPMSPGIVTCVQAIASSDGALTFGPGCDYALPAEIQSYGVQSGIGVALHPKTGKRWGLGLHQCSYPRVWTPDERKLLEEVGRRMGDVLTSLLMFRALQESEQALRQSEAYLAEAQRLSHTGSWAFDVASYTYFHASEECFRIFGFDPQDGYPTTEAVFRRIHPEDRDSVERSFLKSFREKEDSSHEHRIVLGDGTVKHVQTIRHPVLNQAGDVVQLVGTTIDITERKRLEEQLRQSEKMEAVGTLAGGIAHDFNNMLSVIILNAEHARDDVEGRPRMNIDEIINASRRAADLVSQILTFSRKSEYEKNTLSLTPLIKETYKLLRTTLPATIEMQLEITTASDTILGDPSEIQQVLMNLATNAYHAMQDKGGRLFISLTDCTFGAHDTMLHADLQTGRYVQVSVKDTGSGMTDDVKARMFEPFFTTKEKGRGTGLGLAVVYGIVKSHGGAIRVETGLGKGSTFTIFFPAIEDVPEAGPEKRAVMPTGSERVLVVDDEASVVKATSETLQRLGYQVMTATTGAEAWKIFWFAPQDFDLIITDAVMPKMTGMALAQKMLGVRPELPIILITGYSESVSAEEAKAAGISEFLIKPLSKQTFAETVRKVLDCTARDSDK